MTIESLVPQESQQDPEQVIALRERADAAYNSDEVKNTLLGLFNGVGNSEDLGRFRLTGEVTVRTNKYAFVFHRRREGQEAKIQRFRIGRDGFLDYMGRGESVDFAEKRINAKTRIGLTPSKDFFTIYQGQQALNLVSEVLNSFPPINQKP